VLVFFVDALAEELANNRRPPEHGHSIQGLNDTVVDQSRNGEALTVTQNYLRISLARRYRGIRKSIERYAVGEVERTHFGSYFEIDAAVGHDRRREIQLNAKWFELDRYDWRGPPPVGVAVMVGNGRSAGQETRGLASTVSNVGSARICEISLSSRAAIVAPKLISGR